MKLLRTYRIIIRIVGGVICAYSIMFVICAVATFLGIAHEPTIASVFFVILGSVLFPLSLYLTRGAPTYRLFLAFAVLVAFTVTLTPGILFYFYRLPVDSARLAQLEPGMTTNEVAALLGTPQEISAGPDPDMFTMWVYGSRYHFRSVEVFFDRQGHFTKYWEEI
jgi:hypothetical protein